MNITVIGANGGIGQPLSLLLKTDLRVYNLNLYDVVDTEGLATDISHLNTRAKVRSFFPKNKECCKELYESLKDANIVVICAGVARKPGMERDDLFKINSKIICSTAEAIAKVAADAFILVVTNPINSIVPVMVNELKKHNAYNPRKVLGVTMLDVLRSNRFMCDKIEKDIDKFDFDINVVGGHSGNTIVPLFSKSGCATYYSKLSEKDKDELIHRVQFGGDEVVNAKKGAGSATMSMAYAAFKFVQAILSSIVCRYEKVVCAYINLDDSIQGSVEAKKLLDGLNYFSFPLTISSDGINQIRYSVLENLDSREKLLLLNAKQILLKDIQKQNSCCN